MKILVSTYSLPGRGVGVAGVLVLLCKTGVARQGLLWDFCSKEAPSHLSVFKKTATFPRQALCETPFSNRRALFCTFGLLVEKMWKPMVSQCLSIASMASGLKALVFGGSGRRCSCLYIYGAEIAFPNPKVQRTEEFSSQYQPSSQIFGRIEAFCQIPVKVLTLKHLKARWWVGMVVRVVGGEDRGIGGGCCVIRNWCGGVAVVSVVDSVVALHKAASFVLQHGLVLQGCGCSWAVAAAGLCLQEGCVCSRDGCRAACIYDPSDLASSLSCPCVSMSAPACFEVCLRIAHLPRCMSG